MKILLICMGGLVLAGCAGDPQVLNDPVFKAGYETGCGLAAADPKTRSAVMKDQPDLYRRGFNSGVQACGGVREVGY